MNDANAVCFKVQARPVGVGRRGLERQPAQDHGGHGASWDQVRERQRAEASEAPVATLPPQSPRGPDKCQGWSARTLLFIGLSQIWILVYEANFRDITV